MVGWYNRLILYPNCRNGKQGLSRPGYAGTETLLYQYALLLLEDVYSNRISPEALLSEIIRSLIDIKEGRRQRIESLIEGLKITDCSLPLSSEDIIIVIEQHLNLTGTSRLPVLLVATYCQTRQAATAGSLEL